MGNFLSENDIKKLIPKRKNDSHKGDNGRVGILGGSKEYFGAPILSALGALNSGCDLVYLAVPKCNFDVSRSYLPDFIVAGFAEDKLQKKDIKNLLKFFEKCDSLVIGPGISNDKTTLKCIKAILENLNCSFILDSYAINILKTCDFKNKKICITPHLGEFANLIGKQIKNSIEEKKKFIKEYSRKSNVTILLKGEIDIIASAKAELALNKTGNAGMTVGGTGDVLAGVVGSFAAQKLNLFDAAKVAVFLVGKSGDDLFAKKGYFYSATEVANNFSAFL
ncbi:MAG: Carbohydrate kinase, YjeF related protein [Candidatus Peregrinibacteria bacterium GW2011_GWA2_33_10]|nr:MAG: Carbohydrate kinase, YjeF related protein [Candidatus Peregrinibacteria bacterium GW2011_GWA2_33_10]OGJ49425.1 MAG: NAD(P)H-hydrate dehydratase [Candidatus Peregrinibacteria bacterium RIFOXYA2_FULL_33_7]